MQQIFGGTTYMASNNLYQPNQRSRVPTFRQHVMDPPSYTKVLSATSFQADPPPAFSSVDPVSSGGTVPHSAPYQESSFDTDTLLPPAFLVDWQKVTPLITVPELRHKSLRKGCEHQGTRKSDQLPSLEILMAWHAYTANPRWYFEDGTRLGKLPPFPLEMAAEFIDDDTLDYLPPSRTETIPPYRSPASSAAAACVNKFAQDLVAVAKGDTTFLAGTVLLPSNGVWKGEDGAKLSQAFVDTIMGPDKAPFLASSHPEALLCERLDENISNAFSTTILEDVRARCRKGMNIENSQIDARIARMKSAYSQEGSTSADLSGEGRKQASFLDKIDALGWLAPGRFDGDAGRLFPLQKAAIRYHAFLHCKSQMQEDMACPTLDIELSWQLHQLKSDSYVAEIQRLFKGQILDQSLHGDRSAALHAAFNPTAQAWSKLYGIPYSTCGCYNVKQALAGPKKPMSMKEKIKAKMSGASVKEQTEISAVAYIANMDVNERLTSHPSSLDFHHAG